ncbi:MAG: vanadium-dependent haloperoxidase [Acidobacteria bacterium]|nr:vanadium-dependent haloperoxidase [Acidobacteriota bacterium]
MALQRSLVEQRSNGDDERYPNKIGSYSKALPHNQLGEVELNAYATLVRARTSQKPDDFELIQLGLGRKLTSPQAGLAMDLEGPDSHHVTLPPAPRFDSAEEAGEMVELYWMALARDVHFSDYDSNPIIAAAAAEISRLSDFRGPRNNARTAIAAQVEGVPTLSALRGRRGNGEVSSRTVFRNNTPGDLTGPWLSQFLTLDFSFGANFVSQKMKTLPAGTNYMTKYQDWLAVQNGADPSGDIQYDPTPRYIRNLRDMAQWVHVDALYQAYLQACLILLEQGARLDSGLPIYDSKVQAGFAQFGGPHILSLVTEVATRALKAVWYQKWFVHHRLRPEEFGGRVHNQMSRAAEYPIHSDVLNSRAVAEVYSKYGTYLLPMAFPEGSPTHASYGSGHATVAGACSTILKAFFDESDVIKNPKVPNADGTALVPYVGAELTVGGELNKVASNVANGRNGAGVHWRTDAINSLRLGEEVAIGILEEQKLTYNDDVKMTLTKFDGTKITI